MTKVLPITAEKAIEKFFKSKPVIRNAKKVEIDLAEMQKFNDSMEKAQQDFRSKSAASCEAVRNFFYNA